MLYFLSRSVPLSVFLEQKQLHPFRKPQKQYRKGPIIGPGLIFIQNVFAGLIFGGAYFRSRGLLLDGILRLKMGWT